MEWPGVHAAHALVAGKPLEGHWFDRTREYMARRRREEFETHDFATKYLVGFSPLPAFRELTPEEYREKVTALIREIEDDAARARDGRPVLGVEKILAQDRFKAPSKVTKSSPRPRFHVESHAVRDALPERKLSSRPGIRRTTCPTDATAAAHARGHGDEIGDDRTG